ncbi:hypothetical protein ACNOYE_38600 [Nannocystaceae bacterium ST9]
MSIASGRQVDRWGEIVAGPWSDDRFDPDTPDIEDAAQARESYDSIGLPQGALASIARALQNIFERYSGSVTRRVVGEADEYGVDGLYVAVLVMRERDAWPALRGEDRQALDLAGRLMTGFAMLPSTGYMQVPPAEVDVLIDRILASVANWARTRLVADLKREYMALLEEYADRLRPMLESAQPLGEDPLAHRPGITIALMERFEHWLAAGSTLASRRAMLAILEGLFR